MNIPLRLPVISVLIAGFLLVVFLFFNTGLGRMHSAENHFRLALIHIQNDKLANANLEIDEALRISPDNAYYVSIKGLIFARIAEREAGGGLFTLFLNGTPRAGQINQEHIGNAIVYYQKAVSLNPRDGLFRHNLGWLYWFSDDREQAIAEFRQAAQSGDKDGIYFISLGLALERIGDVSGAIEAYGSAIRLFPRILEARFFADLKKRDAGMSERVINNAIDDLKEKLREKPDPILQARLGRLYLETDLDSAFTSLNEALNALPNMSIAWLNLGTWYERKEQLEEAQRCFERAVLLESSESLVFAKLGRFYESRKLLSAARTQYEKAVAAELAARSEHSRIILNLYRAKRAEANDMVPKGLLAYCRPHVDFAGMCRTLAAFYSEKQNFRRAYYYDAIWKSHALETELPGIR